LRPKRLLVLFDCSGEDGIETGNNNSNREHVGNPAPPKCETTSISPLRASPGILHTVRALQSDPVIEAYKKDVDRTIIRKNLRLSVEERLRQLMELQRLAHELSGAGRRARRDELRGAATDPR